MFITFPWWIATWILGVSGVWRGAPDAGSGEHCREQQGGVPDTREPQETASDDVKPPLPLPVRLSVSQQLPLAGNTLADPADTNTQKLFYYYTK